MEVTLKIRRQDPRSGEQATQQDYTVDVAPGATVFDAMVQVREEQDGSIAFRGNCGRGACGDCVVRMNGKLTLSCMTPVDKTVKDGVIAIEPAPYARSTKDVMYDSQAFLWSKYRAMKPWLVTDGRDHARPVTEEAMAEVRTLMRCTMCGLCDFGCTVIDVDQAFMGPAALTKAYRFMVDPRDTATKERLTMASEPKGMWDCVHCWEASEHCPVGIEPTHRIMDMRDLSVRHGIRSGKQNPKVARHYDSFAKSVKESGWLDEFKITMDTEGLLGSLRLAPIALKALQRGKVMIKHPKRAGAEHIKRIFEKVEEDFKADQR